MRPLIPRDKLVIVGQLSTVGLSMVIALVIGFGAGYLLDQWLGTLPWLSLVGFVVGVAAGFLNLFRVMKLADPSRPSPTERSDTDQR